MTKQLAGKAALVTGASKGIGAAIARALAAEGAAVAVNYATSREGADAVVAAIAAAGGRAVAVQGDVGRDAAGVVAAAVAGLGGLDVVVNNAGVYAFGPLEAVGEAEYRRQFDTNVLGPLLVTQAALPHLKPGSSVVNVGSSVTRQLPPGSAIYAGSKAAVEAMTRVLAKELGARGVRVNAVNPGATDTEGTAGMGTPEMRAGMIAQTPLGRLGRPDDVAAVATFLASDAAGWVTGEVLTASGGA